MVRKHIISALALCAALVWAEDAASCQAKPFPELQQWGQWIGGGSAGYIYNSYKSNLETCPMGHACVGSCFRGSCDPFAIGKGRYIRGTFCQFIGDNYTTVYGESAYYDTMAACRDGDFLIGMTRGNFTVFSSFRVKCGKGTPRLYADHSQALFTHSFCPQNYVAIARCYEKSKGSCPQGTLKCAPLIRKRYKRSDTPVLHTVAGFPGNERCQAPEAANIHPLSISLRHPRAVTVASPEFGGDFIAVVDGTNKITKTSLLSLENSPSPFVFQETYSRVFSKSNFTAIAASSSHLFLASTAQNTTRIYRTGHSGEKLMHVLGGEIGVDLKHRTLCAVTFLRYREDEATLFIGQPFGFLKWNTRTGNISTVGSPLCAHRSGLAPSSPPLLFPLCVALRQNHTFVVERNGRITREYGNRLYPFRSALGKLAGGDEVVLTGCAYDNKRDVLYMSTRKCVFGYSMQRDFPEEMHVAGCCGSRIGAQAKLDAFREISHLTFHDEQILITDQGAEQVFSVEYPLTAKKLPPRRTIELERSPTLIETTVTKVYANKPFDLVSGNTLLPIASRMVDIRQFLHGNVLITTKNNLNIFDFTKGQLFFPVEQKNFTFAGNPMQETFSDISVAAVRDYVIFFADNTQKAIFAADIRTGKVSCFSEGTVNEIRTEDMVLPDAGEELCIVARRKGKVSVQCVHTVTKSVRILVSDISRYLPDKGKYSIASFRGSLLLSSGGRVIRLEKDGVEGRSSLFGDFPFKVRKMAVDMGTECLLLLSADRTILRASLRETHLPRTNALLAVSHSEVHTRKSDAVTPWQSVNLNEPLIGLTCHDKTNTILFIDQLAIYQAETHQNVREYIPEREGVDGSDVGSFFAERQSSASDRSETTSGSVHFEGNMHLSVFQLVDDGSRNRPVLDVVIHGDSWAEEQIALDPQAFVASILPSPVFTPAIITSSTVVCVDSHRVRMTIGYDTCLEIPREYTEVVLTSNFPEKVTASGHRPFFSHTTSMPQIQINHGSRFFPMLKYLFLTLSVTSLVNSNPISHIFVAVAQGRFVQSALRVMTKPAIHTLSPLYNIIAQPKVIPLEIGRLASNCALGILLLPVLYFLWASVCKAPDSKQRVRQELALRHASTCFVMLTHTGFSHAAYLGMFTSPSFYWIAYFVFCIAGLSFIAYGGNWLRTTDIRWRVNHLLQDRFTPKGVWYPLQAVRFRGIFCNAFTQTHVFTGIIVLVYYQLILLSASVKSHRVWVHHLCTAFAILASLSLSMFYVVFTPMRWKVLNLARGMTLNAVCAFLLMDISGSNEFTTALVAVAVMLMCTIEGALDVFTVWKESVVWHKLVGDTVSDPLAAAGKKPV